MTFSTKLSDVIDPLTNEPRDGYKDLTKLKDGGRLSVAHGLSSATSAPHVHLIHEDQVELMSDEVWKEAKIDQ